MINIKNYEECCGCEACVNICPKQCISMVHSNGFFYPSVNTDSCINCYLCEKVCPINKKINSSAPLKALVGYNKNNKERVNSTSGGIFFILASAILRKKGVVYGVSFDDQFDTVISRVDKQQELKKLQGSKYPQSRVNNIYRQVKNDLSENRIVLFSGTPCQVNGLKLFLQKNYENLYLVDLVCHAVPSPIYWKDYLNAYFPGERIGAVTFKDKRHGWKKWSVVIETNKRTVVEEKLENPYMSSFLCGYNVRPSCTCCEFKGNNRASDITIGDAWGKPENNLELNDDKGLSAIIINTQKGMQLIDDVSMNMIYQQYLMHDVIMGNPAYSISVKGNLFANKFALEMKNKDIKKVFQKYHISNMRGKGILKLSKILSFWRGKC